MIIRTTRTSGVLAKKYRQGSTIEPALNAKYGNVFNSESGFQIEPDVFFNVDGVDHRKCIFNKKVVTYLICAGKPDAGNYYLPFPYPFVAITGNDGKAIRSFNSALNFERGRLLSGEKGFYWTGYQLDLNELCYEMFDIVKAINRLEGDEKMEMYNQRMEGFIGWWREAIDALDYERYVMYYDLPDLKYWSRMPTMKNTSYCDPYHEALRITFLLKEHGDRYTLEMIIRANEKIITLNDEKLALSL